MKFNFYAVLPFAALTGMRHDVEEPLVRGEATPPLASLCAFHASRTPGHTEDCWTGWQRGSDRTGKERIPKERLAGVFHKDCIIQFFYNRLPFGG